MSGPALPFALAALVPVLVGPLPAPAAAAADTLTARLCNGGTITIPLGERERPAQDSPCHPKACHAGSCRAKDDMKRGKRPI